MQDLATLYSGVSDDSWMALHRKLKRLAVVLSSPVLKLMKSGNALLQHSPFGFYDAYEIAVIRS